MSAIDEPPGTILAIDTVTYKRVACSISDLATVLNAGGDTL